MVSTETFIPSAGAIGDFISILVWGLLIIGTISIVAIGIRNKIKFAYKAEVFKRRQDDFDTGAPTAKRVEGKAGYFIKRKTGKTVFRIKYGMMPWHMIELTKLPDPQYMLDNKVLYIQLNKDNFVQAKIKVDWTGSMQLNPVEDDLTYGAYLDMDEKSKILQTSKLTPVTVGMIVMGLIIVAGIVVFYFLSEVG